MSNRRRGATRYRTGYLRSVVWFRRRDTWFLEETDRRGRLQCAACGHVDVKGRLELHHRDYTGVREHADGGWVAGERHEDLISMHPSCHELLHRLIDRDKVLSRHRSRHEATRVALERLRAALKGNR